ncbi:MAG: TraB/GumN family protein [Betaproteobacteria bacterium]|jgi:hypothetical protein|nr:TraB/GumN family protein [Betaproteobacteria bacterium]
MTEMRPMRRALLAAAAAATVFGAVGRGWAGAGSRKRYDKGLLWRVEKDGAPPSYIFGTIHLADPRVAEPSAAVLGELSRSRTFVMELAVDAFVDPSVFDSEQLAEGSKIESLIGAEAYAQMQRLLVERGMSERVIARMKPWAAMLAVASSGSRDASLALDSRLLAAARRAHLRIEALELVEEQIASFDAIPLASQVALLKHALAHRAALEAENETMIRAWLEGDLAELIHFPSRMDSENPGIARHYDELVRHLVYDRTILMHHRLALPLRTGRIFVAVGALHLQGEKGLLALIERDDYRVTRIG